MLSDREIYRGSAWLGLLGGAWGGRELAGQLSVVNIYRTFGGRGTCYGIGVCGSIRLSK